jgi:hypothetical protein
MRWPSSSDVNCRHPKHFAGTQKGQATMPRFTLAILFPLALTLVGCADRHIQPQPESPAQVERAPFSVSSSAEIRGQWDVVSFESYAPVRMHGSTRAAFADFDARGVRLRIECNYSGVNGFVRDGKFVSQRDLRAQTQMGCGPEREARDERYFSFFDREPSVELLSDGRLRLLAGETKLILERTEKRRLAYIPEWKSLAGKWRLESLTHYGTEGGYSGIGLSDVPGRIILKVIG